MKSISGTIRREFEDENYESPLAACTLVFDVQYEFTPGEKMVRYFPDGSGYPGSPPDVEVIECSLVKASDEVGNVEFDDDTKLACEEWFLAKLSEVEEFERFYDAVVEDMEKRFEYDGD